MKKRSEKPSRKRSAKKVDQVEARTAASQKAFLAAYRELGTVKEAAAAAGIGRRTHYHWIEEDEEYAAEFGDVIEDRSEMLEKEAFRRAHDGTVRPVYQGGSKVGEIREFSDTLLIFLLKAAKPDKYKDRFSSELTGKNGGPIQTEDLTALDDNQRAARITELLDSARARRARQAANGS